MKNNDIKTRENIAKLNEVVKEKKKIPKEVKTKINSKVFENIIFAAIITVYLGALSLGMSNIPTENYLMDLKVFALLLLIITIITFEMAYKKDKSSLWIHGVEIMAISIFTTYLLYFYSIYYNTYDSVVFSATILYLVYYAMKILITRKRIIKEYNNKSFFDINEIVKNDY